MLFYLAILLVLILHATELTLHLNMLYTLSFWLERCKNMRYSQRIYTMDEKGFLIGVLSKGKRIFSKQRYEKDGLKQRLQDGTYSPASPA